MDFIRAFFNGDFLEIIYSRLPEGLIALLANPELLQLATKNSYKPRT